MTVIKSVYYYRMTSTCRFLPQPPRVWSRVQNSCTFTNPDPNPNSNPDPNEYLTAFYKERLLYKGNVLQYKANSARLTKKQKYSKLANGTGPSRTKTFATQSATYSNPNKTGLLRVGGKEIPFPNNIVGEPNNIAGPYQYDVPNPDNCNTNGTLLDGGTLVCGSYANPCSKEVVVTGNQPGDLICNPSYCSDVPGQPVLLCWDPSIDSWFPKPRYVMNTSGDKWPQGYKGFVSAVKPEPPVISLSLGVVTWTYVESAAVPTSRYNIYVNGTLTASVPYSVATYTLVSPSVNVSIYVKTVSRTIESEPSNTVYV